MSHLSNIPYRPNATSPDSPWLVALPLTFPAEHSLRRTDSLRIDCPKELPYEFAAGIADRLIGLIRWRTLQWWIKRGREFPKSHIRHWFHANELGERLAGVGVFGFFYGKIGFECLLDAQTWATVAQALERKESIPLSWDIFLDSVYFHSADDLRRCVLELAISNEIMLSETLHTWTVHRGLDSAKVKQTLQGNDYVAHLKRAGKLWNRSFLDDYPKEFNWLKAVWVARGNVAHGNPPLAPLPEGVREITLEDLPFVFESVFVLRNWLGRI